MASKVPIIDLFAGAGGIGVGAVLAGGDLRLSVEMDGVCCKTLALNKKVHPGEIVQADVTSVDGASLRRRAGLRKDDRLVIVGGPPCQPFSKAAYWLDPGDDSRYRRARARGQRAEKPAPITTARPDERRTLVEVFMDRVAEAGADGFVFENVVSITHPRNRHLLATLLERAAEYKYETTFIKANAVEYGVPQLRERVFILGARKTAPVAPAKTHHLPDVAPNGLREAVTAGDALAGLDAPRFAEPEEVVRGTWEKEFREVPPGWNYKFLSEWAGHPRPVFEAETRFWNFLLKLAPDRPSWTIAANPGPWIGPFHWHDRRLRIVEMAALQAFPEGYVFAGSRREKVRQVGNAAPPLLLKHMIRAVLDAVEGGVRPVRRHRRGELRQ